MDRGLEFQGKRRNSARWLFMKGHLQRGQRTMKRRETDSTQMQRGKRYVRPYSMADRDWGVVYQLTPIPLHKVHPDRTNGNLIRLKFSTTWPKSVQLCEIEEFIARAFEIDPLGVFPQHLQLVIVELRYPKGDIHETSIIDQERHCICYEVKELAVRVGHALMFMPEPEASYVPVWDVRKEWTNATSAYREEAGRGGWGGLCYRCSTRRADLIGAPPLGAGFLQGEEPAGADAITQVGGNAEGNGNGGQGWGGHLGWGGTAAGAGGSANPLPANTQQLTADRQQGQAPGGASDATEEG